MVKDNVFLTGVRNARKIFWNCLSGFGSCALNWIKWGDIISSYQSVITYIMLRKAYKVTRLDIETLNVENMNVVLPGE